MNTHIRLHLPAIPYTITRDEYSHDAYTGKVKRFSPMMRSRGFEVYHYGVETSESGANKDIQLMTKEEWTSLRIETIMWLNPKLTFEEAVEKNNDPKFVVSDLSNWSSPLTKEFNKRLKTKLEENYRGQSTDIICVALGKTYQDAIKDLNSVNIETGIGYKGSHMNYRIFESYAWMSHELGTQDKAPANYSFVIPNFFDTNEFKLSLNPTQLKIGFLGRIGGHKGCNIIVELAKMFPHVQFILCGNGDPSPFLTEPNIVYKSPIHGQERSDYLGSCSAVLCLTKYLEPFCGVAVEAQLCGTPVISTDWGGMVETVEQFKTGLRGHTLADYIYGVQMALNGEFDRKYIRERAVKLFDMYKIAYKYEYVFKCVLDIHNGKGGWYSPDSHIYSLLAYESNLPV
jgi:glycosyltransferase involved in cell wall biosynthesis